MMALRENYICQRIWGGTGWRRNNRDKDKNIIWNLFDLLGSEIPADAKFQIIYGLGYFISNEYIIQIHLFDI